MDRCTRMHPLSETRTTAKVRGARDPRRGGLVSQSCLTTAKRVLTLVSFMFPTTRRTRSRLASFLAVLLNDGCFESGTVLSGRSRSKRTSGHTAEENEMLLDDASRCLARVSLCVRKRIIREDTGENRPVVYSIRLAPLSKRRFDLTKTRLKNP